MHACGVVYVATNHDRFVEEAFLSAESIKSRFPDLPVTLFTDRADHAVCAMGIFDTVNPIGGVRGLANEWSAGQLNRLRCLRQSPYEKTLHLDTDTRIVSGEVMGLFDLLDEIDVAMVETTLDDSYSRLHYGHPMFNAGFVLYRQSEATMAWLEEWAALSERNFCMTARKPLPNIPLLEHVADENVRRKLLCMDQISLVEILSPNVNRFGLRLKILDYSWNHRGSRLPSCNEQPIRIVHYARQSEANHAKDLEAALARIER